jgi:hypothetical protein
MANTIYKRKLSGSTDGKAILISQTATAGNTIHTAVAGTTAGTFDEVWLYAYNGHTAAVVLTIEFGGATVPDQNIVLTIPNKAGLTLVVPGLILQNGMVIKAFAATTNVITITGFVNTMTDL